MASWFSFTLVGSAPSLACNLCLETKKLYFFRFLREKGITTCSKAESGGSCKDVKLPGEGEGSCTEPKLSVGAEGSCADVEAVRGSERSFVDVELGGEGGLPLTATGSEFKCAGREGDVVVVGCLLMYN